MSLTGQHNYWLLVLAGAVLVFFALLAVYMKEPESSRRMSFLYSDGRQFIGWATIEGNKLVERQILPQDWGNVYWFSHDWPRQRIIVSGHATSSQKVFDEEAQQWRYVENYAGIYAAALDGKTTKL